MLYCQEVVINIQIYHVLFVNGTPPTPDCAVYHLHICMQQPCLPKNGKLTWVLIFVYLLPKSKAHFSWTSPCIAMTARHLCFPGLCGPSRPWCLLTTTFGTLQAEMELVQRIGVPASKIIYANPCKQIAQIKYAAKHGVQLLSFDNEMELAKVAKSHPSAK